MIPLKRSNDRKTANGAMPSGKTPRVKNAFGLPAGSNFSCPGMTSVCENICYANKLEKLFPGFRNAMESNWAAVKDASYDDLYEALNSMIADFIADCEKWNVEKLFRIHHDGDFFSITYAKAWADVIRDNAEVTFWAYTRSFTNDVNVVPEFAELQNLSLYLSVDTANANDALKIKKDNPWVKIAGLEITFDAAADIVKNITGRNSVARCPELNGAIPLIDERGGACKICSLCITGKSDVTFSISKK